MDDPVTLMRSGPAGRELAPLLQRIGQGDRAALSSLYERTSAKLFGICVRLLGSGEDAEDVLQDVYLTVWRRADRFDAGRASPITWLAVIARNRAIDRLRQRRSTTADLREALDIPDDAPTASDIAEQGDERQRLLTCLQELDERQRSMIRAAFLDGASYPELAGREAVPLSTVKSWVRRGLQRLRGCLER